MTAHERWGLASCLLLIGTGGLGCLAVLRGVGFWPPAIALTVVYAVCMWRGRRTGDWKPKAETLGRWAVDESGKVRRVE